MYSDGVANAQRVLRAMASYRGAIDGDPGPRSLAAAWRLEGRREGLSDDWSAARIVVSAAQVALRAEGYRPGPADGLWGPQTDAAFDAWCGTALPERDSESDFGRQGEMQSTFGPAGHVRCTAGRIIPPWRMVLAWDRDQVISAISCHEAVAASGQRALERAAEIYSAAEIRDLGLHLFGGCFNYRVKRGGSTLSVHAYGAAIDFDPERNRLRWGADRARLGRPDAAPFWDAWEGEGWTSLGRARNYDWMHVQAPGL